MSQKTARPRLTSCFMSRMRASRGQHFLLLYLTQQRAARGAGGGGFNNQGLEAVEIMQWLSQRASM